MLKQTKCPNCGAQIDVDMTNDKCICQYCGTKLFNDKTENNSNNNASNNNNLNNNTYYNKNNCNSNNNNFNNNAYNNSNNTAYNNNSNISSKNNFVCLILCLIGFLGIGGLHDFYLERIGKGIIKLITVNWFYIGTIIDALSLVSGSYKDKYGYSIKKIEF